MASSFAMPCQKQQEINYCSISSAPAPPPHLPTPPLLSPLTVLSFMVPASIRNDSVMGKGGWSAEGICDRVTYCSDISVWRMIK